jgi:hypothetical protein
MTTASINAIGYCVNYSEQGEWAFSLALDIARRNELQLNIFHFVADPYNKGVDKTDDLNEAEREQMMIDLEREMRMYYDERLGDYLDAGFRLCEENEWTELHRCLCKQEFQLLVLALPSVEATFGTRRLVDFAKRFVCPVVLVGPDAKTELTLNEPARLIAYRLGLDIDMKRAQGVEEHSSRQLA